MIKPKLSIVVPVYNGRKFIQDTLDSLQQLEEILSCELIFQNAESTDGTSELLDTFCQDHDNRVHYNEPDSGQSDAINRGIARSSGKWVTWLCADDILLPALASALEKAEDSKAEVVYGDVLFLNGSNVSPAAGTESYVTGSLAKRRLIIQQPGTCILRSIWDSCQGVRLQLNWAMDYDLFLRMESDTVQFLRIDDFLAVIRIHPEAKTSSGSLKRMLELWSILWQSHKRKPVYFRLRPYVVYGFEFVIKSFESRRNKGAVLPPKVILSLCHRLFWLITGAREKTAIQQRFHELSGTTTALLKELGERSGAKTV